MRGLAVLVVVAACGGTGDDGGSGIDAGDGRVVIAEIPVVVNRDLDILFAIDDSPGGLDQQTLLKSALPAFIDALNGAQGGLPNIHLGVVSSDLGTLGAGDATAGPAIGSGPGSCSGTGKTGKLQTNGTALLTGSFIADTRNTDGTRSLNYTGLLSDAIGAIVSLGGSGCGFEQPVDARPAPVVSLHAVWRDVRYRWRDVGRDEHGRHEVGLPLERGVAVPHAGRGLRDVPAWPQVGSTHDLVQRDHGADDTVRGRAANATRRGNRHPRARSGVHL
jgi:hypothetical protein